MNFWLLRTIGVVAFVAASFVAGTPARSAPLESAVKAAYLYKMAAFVTWPPTSFSAGSAPFRICVINRNDVAGPVAELTRGQQAWGRTIAVAQFASARDPGVNLCQILFTGGEKPAFSDGAPVLIVTEKGAPAPGVVEFTVDGGHVRFVIHRSQAEARRLGISSKLLAVAQAVVP